MEEDESDSGSSVVGEEKTLVQVKKRIICKVCKADRTRGDELTMN